MPRHTIYTQDSDLDGLTDAQEMALGTNPLSPDSDGDGQADLVEILSGRQATVDEMRQVLQAFMRQSYETYVKALFAVEHQITSESFLNDLYYYYKAEDNIGLLDEQLVQEIERQEEIIKDDLAILFEHLYGLGEANEFIQEVLNGQTSRELVSPQSWNLGEYDHYSLETLDDLILNQLPKDSTDYFDDLVQLAIRQNSLDSKAQFLEAYLADLVPKQAPQPDFSLAL
ncbi:OmpA domain-containing protein [Streptococcus pyogenes]|nr:OmpA domain-containing protein [Streptococcus pyogenes]VGV98209.1 OmpA domain-containing protein [Streptococcus pyogenes]VGW88681.1 OmpA domain-containing protein [Streptococcus pyogenes]VGZ97365.1 OmpA domain-containing protein [Streptococcus pyogenes]VHA98717.1 OmpA domain-containing protein [Streptococcus pyogenes]